MQNISEDKKKKKSYYTFKNGGGDYYVTRQDKAFKGKVVVTAGFKATSHQT